MSRQSGVERRRYVRAGLARRCELELLPDQKAFDEAAAGIDAAPLDPPYEALESEAGQAQIWLMESVGRLSEAVETLNRKVDLLLAHARGDATAPPEPLQAQLYDFSGGGLSFFSDHELEDDAHYRIVLRVSTAPPAKIPVIGCIRWRQQAEDGAPASWRYGAEISYVREPDRERIIKEVFRLQREELRARKESRAQSDDGA